VTAALHDVLALLCGDPLPLDVAMAATHEPDTALRLAWERCDRPWPMRNVLQAAGDRGGEASALRAWAIANDEYTRTRAPTSEQSSWGTWLDRLAFIVVAIRAAVPCPAWRPGERDAIEEQRRADDARGETRR
jgi:hypothetical protein